VKKLLILLIVVGAALAAGAYWLNHVTSGLGGEESFTLTPVEWGTLTESVSATGQLQPQEVVAVGSELSGKVVEIYPAGDVNQSVEEGEPLLKLDDRLAHIKLEEAQTAVSKAQAGVEAAKANRSGAEIKVQRLSGVPETVGLRGELDEAQLKLKQAIAGVMAAEVNVQEAEAAQKQAQFGLDLTIVRAPSDPSGTPNRTKRRYTVIDRKVVLGQLVAPPASAQLFTLASDLARMQVHAQVSENDIGKIRTGLSATFTVYAYSEGDVRFHGKVVEIRPMPTNLHGAVFYDTLIDVPNERDKNTKEWRLRPGMTAAVDIVLREHTNVWKVPSGAINFQLDEHYQSEAARAKLAQWHARADQDDWKPVWILDSSGKPWPVFVRIGGKNAAGEAAIGDGQFNEVLDWDPDLNPKPDAKTAATYPRVITGAPPPSKKGLFDRANVRVF
jgi:HlyD family secretion protein